MGQSLSCDLLLCQLFMMYTKYMLHVGLSTAARFNHVIAEQMADGGRPRLETDTDLQLSLLMEIN